MIIEEIKNISSGTKDLRKFGITLGIFFGLLGGLFLWQEKDYYYYFFILSGAFMVLGLAVPVLLKPIHKIWMTLSIHMGWLMTRVILIVLFYLVVTPISILGKCFNKNFLELKINKTMDSYWIKKNVSKFQRRNYEKQF
jgi:hypothetical protein